MSKLIFILVSLVFIPLNLFAATVENCGITDGEDSYNVIIYSNSFINDPETFIVLDKVNDNVTISPYAPSFNYRTIENVNGKEGLKIANEVLLDKAFVNFLRCSPIREEGTIFGYEIKPIYHPWVFRGIMEPLQTVYRKEGNTISIYIHLHPRVRRQVYDDDSHPMRWR
ncbi:MAG TPA: hypothetical protein PKZ17_01115 [Thermodesulfovibrio thiophilus]|nr:hypothetical protein [Thermodesulfovibrio thiophilus]